MHLLALSQTYADGQQPPESLGRGFVVEAGDVKLLLLLNWFHGAGGSLLRATSRPT